MPQEILTYSSTVSDSTGGDPSRLQALDGGFFLMPTVSDTVIIELTDLTGNVGTINWIQYTIHGNGITGKQTALAKIKFYNGSNNELYSEDQSFNPPGIQTFTGTQRTTSNGGSGGSTAWTESDINSLRVGIVFSAESGANDLSIDFIKVTVDYNEAVAIPAFKLTSGLLKITEGLVKV